MEGVINSNITDFSIKPAFNFSKEQQKDLNILIREDMDNVKLKVLEQILREKDIAFDSEIKDYKVLKKSLKQNVSKNTLAEINKEEELARKEIHDFIKVLESGGPLTLQKTINTFNEKVLRPSAKFATTYLISRALFDSMLFLP